MFVVLRLFVLRKFDYKNNIDYRRGRSRPQFFNHFLSNYKPKKKKSASFFGVCLFYHKMKFYHQKLTRGTQKKNYSRLTQTLGLFYLTEQRMEQIFYY